MSRQVDCIIAGQGLCGTLLSYLLIKAGLSVVVFDEFRPNSAGQVASGLINPVTGMRLAKAAQINELLPVAFDTYSALEHLLGTPLLQPYHLVHFHKSVEDAALFRQRLAQFPEYLSENLDEIYPFNAPFGAGIIKTWLLDIRQLISGWRSKLHSLDVVVSDQFSWADCMLTPAGIRYQDVSARIVISCEGMSIINNPYFMDMPMAPNKGEALIISVPGLSRSRVYQRSLKITPWQQELFWVGSSFEWSFIDDQPGTSFRATTETELRNWLKLPFEVMDHLASVRPSTRDREPIARFHREYPQIGVLNGMGAKGCSQAPLYAKMLADKIIQRLT